MTGTGTASAIGARERDVEALPGAVAIHGGEQDFAGAERDHLARIVDGVEPGRVASAMGEDFPAVGLARLRHLLGVDRDHDALVAEFLRRLLHEGAARHRRGVDRHLVGAARQQLADVLDRAHAAADGERHEAGLGGAPHHVEDDVAVFVARGDVEEGELVGAGRVIGDRRLDRIAGIAQIDEIDALDDAAVLHVEAGNDADLEHVRHAARAARISLQALPAGIEPAVIERAAGDGAGKLSVRAARSNALHVVDARQARPRRSPGSSTASASAMVASRLRPLSMPSRAMSV